MEEVEKNHQKTQLEYLQKFFQFFTKIFPLRQRVDDINKIFYSKIAEKEQKYQMYQDTTARHYVSSNLPIPPQKLEKISKITVQKEVQKLMKENDNNNNELF